MTAEEAHLGLAERQALATGQQQQQGQHQRVQHRCQQACCPLLVQTERRSRKYHLLTAYLPRLLLGPALQRVSKPVAKEQARESPAQQR